MEDLFLGPKRYVQKPGALAEAAGAIRAFGRRPLLLADETVERIVGPAIRAAAPPLGLEPLFLRFGVECSPAEIERVAAAAAAAGADVIVGTGGGKALDTARAAAGRLGLPLVTLPTSAATCAATSSLSVLYEGGIRTGLIDGKAAELVLVDSAVVAAAPPRLIAAGIADTLAKWSEGKPTFDRDPAPAPALQAAMDLSTRAREILLREARQACADARAGKATAAVEHVIECNLLLAGMIGGVGGRTFRVALAHGLLYGLTVLPEIRRHLHGEVVGWGLLVQACLEGKREEFRLLRRLFLDLGLPTTMADLGLRPVDDPGFREGLRRTCEPGGAAHNLAVPVDEERLLAAILEAEAAGREAGP
ncbi:MAG: iron-containing alcohol dehydrogenase [Desulfobacterales bacterium]